MSQYPYGYSNQWPPPASGMPGYGYQPPMQGQPDGPSYQMPHGSGVLQGHYATSQAAFDHNARTIPGLGITSPTSQVGAGWNQLATYPSYTPEVAVPYHAYPALYTPHQQQPRAPAPPSNNSVQPGQQLEDTVEDGEVSEGQFEDLYEPAEAAVPIFSTKIPDPPNLPNRPMNQNAAEPETSGSEIQDDAFYEDDEPGEIAEERTSPGTAQGLAVRAADEGTVNSSRARGRSGSYSPYLSPREVHHDEESSDESGSKQIPPASTQTSAIQTKPNKPHGLTPQAFSTLKAATTTMSAEGKPNAQHAATYYAFHTVEDAKKEAQKAILRLYSAGVKFQTYLDEGFDESLIKSLFAELGLQSVAPKPSPQPQSKKEASRPNNSIATKGLAVDKSEERKDRIARLLAAKASKPAQPTQPSPKPNPSQPPVQKQPPALPGKQKSKTDKDILLQQKLEALQKSREDREARARASDQKAEGAVPRGANIEPSAVVLAQNLMNLTNGSQTPTEIPSEVDALIQDIKSSAVAAPPASTRKRPVASDFVDYSATVGSLKRPFGQHRQGSSFVIDISDTSDDEDVEMEVDSQAEEDDYGRRMDIARKGLAVRDYPPLSDTLPSRPYASSVSSLVTPPNGLSNGNTKSKEDEYARKMREIEEMKRRIAVFEARKAMKVPTGSQTPTRLAETPSEGRQADANSPTPATPTPADDAGKPDGPSAQLISEAVSARLPKKSDTAQSANNESPRDRRERIVSLQLPKVEANLREKMAKLKLLQDKVAQLQAEVDQNMAEKQRLAEEAGELDQQDEENSVGLDSQVAGTEIASSSKHVELPQDTADATVSDSGNAMDMSQAEEMAKEDIPTESVPYGQPTFLSQAQTTLEPGPAQSTTCSPEAVRPIDNVPASTLGAIETQQDDQHDRHVSTAGSESADSMSMDEDNQSEAYEPVEASEPSPTGHLALDSPQPGGRSRPDAEGHDANAHTNIQDELTPLPAQISDVTRASPEAEGSTEERAVREGSRGSTSKSSFTPYESPLTYFRSYRFHPQFKNSVPGGLRSLTYNSKIKPEVEICPHELAGTVCPQGDSCEHQHFKSMAAKDDQILVELGKSDDFSGEQKTRFVQGLREVLQKFRAEKVKDFDTIANGIIEYRRRFVGDESRVLTHLEGVSL